MITIRLSIRDWLLVLRALRYVRDHAVTDERSEDTLCAVIASIEAQEVRGEVS